MKTLPTFVAALAICGAAALPSVASAAGTLNVTNSTKPTACIRCGTVKFAHGADVTNPGNDRRIIWQGGTVSRFAKVMINPQPLPPKVAYGAASRFAKVALNPQPLPPRIVR